MKRAPGERPPASIALSRSRPLLSRSLATRASASASVRFAIPCWVRKWNLTQTRSLAAFIIEKGWPPTTSTFRTLSVVPAAQRGGWVGLDRGVQVREPQRSAEEEHRRVIADDVPVALLGIELEGGAADVAFRIGRAALAGHGREAREHGRLLPDLRENLGLGVARDVVGHREGAVGTPALGVHAPLRDHFPVEMRHLPDP